MPKKFLILLLVSGVFVLPMRATIITNAWVPIFKGVDFTTGEADTNEVRLQKIRALRVDLTDPAVEMFSTPSNGTNSLETDGQTTTTFVNTYGVAAGVNANFFSPVSTIPNDPRDLSGLAVSRGTLVSPGEAIRPMLLITRSNVATITATVPSNPTNYWTAVAGSDRILINGVVQLASCTNSFCNENPRTAAGTSSNGRYLYLMVIDGRQPGWSEGATLAETGEWLKRLGAWQGLNLDGGGSTAMAKIENGAAVLLNKPSGGVQRVNGNHIGVFSPAIAPVIVTQPKSQSAAVGTNVTLTVNAGGTTPLRYQWRFNQTNVLSATNSSLTLTNVPTASSGSYSVVVTNAVGTATSSSALLTVVVFLDVTNVTVVSRPSSAIITWTSKPATISQIEYGIEPNFGNFSPLETSSQTNHKVLLVGLLPNQNYNFRIRSRIGPDEVVSGPYSFSTDVSVIVDNPDATYAGVWAIGTSSTDKFGSSYQYAGANLTATARATFTPTIQTAGKYDVAIWYPQGTNRSTNAPVTVIYNGGALTTSINQRTNGGAWRLVAPSVDCVSGNGNFAFIENNTGETNGVVMADAMRWSYTPEQDLPTDGLVPSWWSDFYFGTNVDASLDPDGDGYSTFSEYIVGTMPNDAGSYLRVVTQRTANGLNIVFSPAHGGRVYELQSSTNVAGPAWVTLTNSPVTTNGQGIFSITNSSQPGPHFYRLSVGLEP